MLRAARRRRGAAGCRRAVLAGASTWRAAAPRSRSTPNATRCSTAAPATTWPHAYLGGADAAQPLASPLLGALRGLPPLLVHVGRDEVLRDDALRLAAKAREAGVTVELQVFRARTACLAAAAPLARGAALGDARRPTSLRPRSPRCRPGAAGRADRRRGAVGHRRGRAPAAALPGQELHAAGITAGARRHLGPVPLPRRALRLRHVHAGLRLQALDAAQGHRRRRRRSAATSPRRRDEYGIDAADPLRHRVLRRRLVVGRALAGRSRCDAATTRSQVVLRASFLSLLQRLLQLCAGPPARRSRRGPLRAARWCTRSSGRRTGPCRQARGGDRQRRHRGDAGARAWRKTAAHVTMLQRSPSYVVARPGARRHRRVAASAGCRRRLAYRLVRAKNVLMQHVLLPPGSQVPGAGQGAADRPGARAAAAAASTSNATSRRATSPWDQRVCLVPDGDLFRACARAARRWSPTRSRPSPSRASGWRSGQELRGRHDRHRHRAGTQCAGRRRGLARRRAASTLSQTLVYKGMMNSGMPNLANTFGYTNASWTLKADLTARYLCRLLRPHGPPRPRRGTPRRDASVGTRTRCSTSPPATCSARCRLLPRQGDRKPWKLYQNYVLDWLTLRLGKVRRRRAGLRARAPRLNRPAATVDRVPQPLAGWSRACRAGGNARTARRHDELVTGRVPEKAPG